MWFVYPRSAIRFQTNEQHKSKRSHVYCISCNELIISYIEQQTHFCNVFLIQETLDTWHSSLFLCPEQGDSGAWRIDYISICLAYQPTFPWLIQIKSNGTRPNNGLTAQCIGEGGGVVVWTKPAQGSEVAWRRIVGYFWFLSGFRSFK
jgi:hypothetical protein